MSVNLNTPLLSIIIVTYNAENFVESTIKSILNQNFKSYEIVIIDGKSTDSTLEIISSYNHRINKLISEKDNGIYDAMNKGIINSIGEWIIYLNAGDIFYDNNVLSAFYNSINNSNSEIIYGNYSLYNNTVIKQSNISNRLYFFSNTICHQSAFIKKSVFKLIGDHNLNYKIISDREFFLRAFLNKIIFNKIEVTICFWDSVGFSSNNHLLYVDEVKRFRNLHYSFKDKLVISIKKYLINL
jgi:glycosyltransferase involved in cell wall biosynthesis